MGKCHDRVWKRSGGVDVRLKEQWSAGGLAVGGAKG
jgi:hypothetical protein